MLVPKRFHAGLPVLRGGLSDSTWICAYTGSSCERSHFSKGKVSPQTTLAYLHFSKISSYWSTASLEFWGFFCFFLVLFPPPHPPTDKHHRTSSSSQMGQMQSSTQHKMTGSQNQCDTGLNFTTCSLRWACYWSRSLGAFTEKGWNQFQYHLLTPRQRRFHVSGFLQLNLSNYKGLLPAAWIYKPPIQLTSVRMTFKPPLFYTLTIPYVTTGNRRLCQ